MKVAYVARAYPGVAAAFYAARPGLGNEGSAAQLEAFQHHAFGWAGAWGPALAPLGHELREFWLDLEPLHRAWARERGTAPGAAAAELLVAQVAEFAPDVLWLDHAQPELLGRLRAACPALRASLGWVGSALPDTPIWRRFDRVLSCDAASVAELERGGARAELLHHAFQERVLTRIFPSSERHDVVFVGQFDPGAPAHAAREAVLDALVAARGVAIFSPSADRPGRFATAARRLAWGVATGLRRAGVPDRVLRPLPGLGRAASWPGPPRGPLPARVAAAIAPARFGLDMYRTLGGSRVTLNVQGVRGTHASSNMRLFEATGMGSALLTDAAGSIGRLFEPGREVATYESAAECVERVGWLLDHESERAAMARAGQARCLAEHTFAHRAPRLAEILRSVAG